MIPAYTIKTDSTTTADVTYIGFCNSLQVDDDAAIWAIKRITKDGDDVTVENAGGTGDPVHVWTDRATLQYK